MLNFQAHKSWKGKKMEVRYLRDNRSYRELETEDLRKNFLVEDLFQGGTTRMVYLDADRAIVGGAIPLEAPLLLPNDDKKLACEFFTQRREIGIFNVGGVGKIKADGKEYLLQFKDALYIGRGTKEIAFSSIDNTKPANFYFVSFPSHSSYPNMLMKFGEVYSAKLGSKGDANQRTINRYIHDDGVKSSQLVMGLTDLEEGSVWNTMPVHTHQRRTEIYFYFGLDNGSMVFHMMGEPNETRHIIVRDKQAVISPSWSIHSGVGTKSYSFIWAMGGENQDYSDMDAVENEDLK
jgi:4-deoxy-L-threo-5-hexosulose-uronate ketol-isomerase